MTNDERQWQMNLALRLIGEVASDVLLEANESGEQPLTAREIERKIWAPGYGLADISFAIRCAGKQMQRKSYFRNTKLEDINPAWEPAEAYRNANRS